MGASDSEVTATKPDQAPATSGAGRVLAGRYRLGSRLGSGGLATVVEAHDEKLDRSVAVKVLREDFANDPVFLERFTREALHVSGLSHPGLVTVFDAGVDAGTAFIVMERVDGRTLGQVLAAEGRLRIDHAVQIAVDICEVLAVTHRAGVVHRDIKPGNIFLADDGRTRVIDFGIARADGEDPLTQTATMIGTAAYISPEQAVGGSAGPQSDLYAVGCVLFEMLTGVPPFAAESPMGLLYRHAHDVPPPPSTMRPEVPPELDDVVLRMLAKEPSDRPAGAEAARAALLTTLHGPVTAATPAVPTLVLEPVVLPAVLGPEAPTRVLGTDPPTAVIDGTTRTRARGARPVLLAAALGVLALLAVLVAFLVGRAPATSAGAGASPAGASPSAMRSTPVPTPPSRTPSASAVITVPDAASPAEAVAAMRQVIAQGLAAGLIDREAGSRLNSLLDDLATTRDKGKGRAAKDRLGALTDQVATFVADGSITGAAVPAVEQVLGQLAAALDQPAKA